MESFREDNLKGMNASAGGLVWVRRRNGSWWPGRILCVDELAKCLRTNKAGTPIKLLGREEGHVDWYNLEKSKRIKAFRCGEYDDCIEKAKASAIHPSRTTNSVKYARRVDAILHALELEKCYLTNGNEKLSSSKNNSKIGRITEELLKQRKMMLKNRSKLVLATNNSGKPEECCTHEFSHSAATIELPEEPLRRTSQKKRWKNPNDYEDDDGDEGIRRMKDLEDLGLEMISVEKPKTCFRMKKSSEKGSSGCILQNEPDFANNLSSISSRFKHSYSRIFHVYQNLKRRSRRRRRLTKIWVGSEEVNVPLIYQDSVITGDLPSCGVSMNRLNDLNSFSKKTKFLSLDNSSVNCSESSYEGTSLHVLEKNGTAVHDFNPPPVVRDEVDDSLSNGLVNVPILIGESNVEGFLSIHKTCTSRKIHSYTAEKLSVHSVQVCLVSKSGEGLVEASSTNSVSPPDHIIQRLKKNNSGLYSKVERHSRYSSLNMNPDSGSFDDDEADKACDGSLSSDISDQSVRCGSLSELSNIQETQTLPASINNDTSNNFVKCEQSVVSISPRCAVLKLSNSSSVASLYDVALKVQANYPGQRAPLVSLVSKLNGKAIVGHAVTVDVLDDGSSTILLKSVRHLTGCKINLPRRRVDIICKLHEKLDHLAKPSCLNTSLLIRKPLGGRNLKRSSLLKRKPLGGRKFGFSPRKIRRLSSITVDLNNREKDREVIVEKVEASSVSCIPVRIVFSRLHEALSYSSRLVN